MRHLGIRIFFALVVGITATPVWALSVFRIGNSLTWDSNPDGIAALAAQEGVPWDHGYHLRGSSSLRVIYDNPTDVTPFNPSNLPYGFFTEALPSHEWDVVVLQSYRNVGQTLGSDIDAAFDFIDLTRTNPDNADTHFYIYTSWIHQSGWPFWEDPVPNELSTPLSHQQQYFQNLSERVTTQLGELVHLVPIGDVLARVDDEALAGQLPGLTSVRTLYRDNVHMNTAGSYIAGLTVYTTLTGQDPRGTAIPDGYWEHELLTPELIDQYQEIVWDVVANHPYSGVVGPRRGDFDDDGDVDWVDHAVWQAAYENNIPLFADGNGDRAVDELDSQLWEIASAVMTAGFASDFNEDGAVDAADYALWKANFGTASSVGDANQDGQVGAADYTIWRDEMQVYESLFAADYDQDGTIDADDLVVWEGEEGLAWDLTPDLNGDLVVDQLDGDILLEDFYDPSTKAYGDFDSDGDVDMDDFDIWDADFGSHFRLAADANYDGVVDTSDYTIWEDNLGLSGLGSGDAVPEPAACWLCSLLSAMLYRWQRQEASHAKAQSRQGDSTRRM